MHRILVVGGAAMALKYQDERSTVDIDICYRDILEVYIVDDLDLYCMKLVSFRPKDIQDIETLSESLKANQITYKDVVDNINHLYGDEYLLRNDSRKLRFLTMHFQQ